MIGDFAVGKTSLVHRFVSNTFSDRYLTTIGVRVMKKEVSPAAGAAVTLLLWDIAGGDSFSRVSPEYLRGAAFGVIVGDATRRETLESLPGHVELFRSVNPDSGYVIALNKTDLLDDRDAAPHALGLPGSLKHDNVMLTSAKDGRNVEEMFIHVAAALLKKSGD